MAKLVLLIVIFLAISVNIVAYFAEKKMNKKLAKLASQKQED